MKEQLFKWYRCTNVIDKNTNEESTKEKYTNFKKAFHTNFRQIPTHHLHSYLKWDLFFFRSEILTLEEWTTSKLTEAYKEDDMIVIETMNTIYKFIEVDNDPIKEFKENNNEFQMYYLP